MKERCWIVARLKATLDPERFAHSLRVEQVALALARRHRVSLNKASLAALLHDCARRDSRSGLLKKARRLGLTIDPVQAQEPKLLHGELGARLAREEFEVKARDILAAIRHHTTGRPKMSKLEKIVFLADHIEEGRDYTGLKNLRRLAFRDLDGAVVESASRQIAYLLRKKVPIHPGSVLTRNSYL
ncbi:MAG: bis(5'-nucleosyl)-tetraphosphatase (symmetrical) YqeK [Candidatus Margulisiibacteriota bacterium]